MSKPIVHYKGKAVLMPYGGAWIEHPIDHPDTERVTNTMPIHTSKVISFDEETGRIETQNTIYERVE